MHHWDLTKAMVRKVFPGTLILTAQKALAIFMEYKDSSLCSQNHILMQLGFLGCVVVYYQTIRRQILDDFNLNIHRPENNLKSHTNSTYFSKTHFNNIVT